MTNPFLTFMSLASPVEGSFRTVIVPSGFWITIGGLLAELAGAVSVTAGFSGGGLSAPITAAGEAQAVRKARTGDNRFFDHCIFSAPDCLDRNPLDFIEAHIIPAPIIKARGTRGLMRGDLLGDFQTAAIPQVCGNPGRPEGMVSDPGVD